MSRKVKLIQTSAQSKEQYDLQQHKQVLAFPVYPPNRALWPKLSIEALL